MSLLKISRAVDGDDWFRARVQIACEIGGVEFTRPLLISVAQAVCDNIQISGVDGSTVSTEKVSDEQIFKALDAYPKLTVSTEKVPDEQILKAPDAYPKLTGKKQE